MGKILDIILVVFLLGIGFVSCGDDGCMENRSSIPLIAFYSDADRLADGMGNRSDK